MKRLLLLSLSILLAIISFSQSTEVNNGSLTASTSNKTFRLSAATETDFYITSSFDNMYFVKDDKGNVAGFESERYGSGFFANKIK